MALAQREPGADFDDHVHLSKPSFDEVGLKVRQNRLGYFGYLFTYQLFMSPVSVAGYTQELFGAARRW